MPAGKELLSYVSGLNSKTAKAMVHDGNSNGAFESRKAILKVPGLGAKQPLDASAVHPERYSLVEQIPSDLHASVDQSMKRPALRSQIDLKRYESRDVGMPTLTDIMAELEKPGHDPPRGVLGVLFCRRCRYFGRPETGGLS